MTALDTRQHLRAATERAPRGQRYWQLVAAREISLQLRDKSFVGSTLFSLILLIGVFAMQFFLAARPTTYEVAVASEQAQSIVAAARSQQAEAGTNTVITPVEVPDEAAGRRAVQRGEATALLSRSGENWHLTGDSSQEPGLQQAVTEAVKADLLATTAEQAGRNPQQVAERGAVGYSLLDQSRPHQQIYTLVSVVFAIVFYFSCIMFGVTIANSVVQEKQSPIVEIIAAAIPIDHLLIGKVVGNVVLALTQVALYLGVGMLGLLFTPYAGMVPFVLANAGWFALFYLVGFGALSCLCAMCGSLASRMEDIAHTLNPVNTAMLAALLLGIFLDGFWLKIASYVPVLSSIAMPRRLLEGTAAWWEAPLALALTVAFSYAALKFSVHVYRRALMQMSGRLGIRQALKLQG